MRYKPLVVKTVTPLARELYEKVGPFTAMEFIHHCKGKINPWWIPKTNKTYIMLRCCGFVKSGVRKENWGEGSGTMTPHLYAPKEVVNGNKTKRDD